MLCLYNVLVETGVMVVVDGRWLVVVGKCGRGLG